MHKLLVACNVGVCGGCTFYNTPFVLYEIGRECCILLAIIDEGVAVANNVAFCIAPVAEVVSCIWCGRNLYRLLVCDAELVCSFDSNSAICSGNGRYSALLGYLLHNGNAECYACAVAVCHGCFCLANLCIGRYGNCIACELFAFRCSTVGIDVNPCRCDVNILAYFERKLCHLSAVYLSNNIALCCIAFHTHREQVVLVCTLYTSEVFAECPYGFFGCTHVAWDNNLGIVIVGVINRPWIFETVVPTSRRCIAVVLEEVLPTLVVEILD